MSKEIIQQGTNNNTTLSIEQDMQKLPLIGCIPLGTGNGVGLVVGCHLSNYKRFLPGAKQRKRKQFQSLLEKLKNVVSNQDNETFEMVELPMMQVMLHDDDTDVDIQELCFFAGTCGKWALLLCKNV